MKALLNLNMQVQGLYTLHKGKMVDGVALSREKVAEFENLITDHGLDRLNNCPGAAFSIQTLNTRCLVGTSSVPPAVTDGGLGAFLASTTTTQSDVTSFVDEAGAVPAYWRRVTVFRFSAGTATGNLTEVGAGWSTTDIFSHALILDGGGVPTTITVLADEYLDVTYEVRSYIDKSDHAIIATISGVNYDVVYRPYDIDTTPQITRALASPESLPFIRSGATQTLATVYNFPTGITNLKNGSLGTYTTGNYYNDCTFTYGLSEANYAGGIGTLTFDTTQCKFQMNFTPKIPKDGTKIFTITIRVNWARYP